MSQAGISHVGNVFTAADAFVLCFAESFATLFTKALAEATASSQCFEDGGDAAATAAIVAEVGVDVFEYEACYDTCYVDVSDTRGAPGPGGHGDTSLDGFDGTFTVRRACLCMPPTNFKPWNCT